MTRVLGTDPVTSLARIGRLDVLEPLSNEVLVPEQVYRPFAEHAFRGSPTARRVERAGDEGLFRVFALPAGTETKDRFRENPRVTHADAATLALADYSDGTAVTDATYTRKLARIEEIETRSTAALIIAPVADGSRPASEALDLVETLLAAGWNPVPVDYAEIVETLNDLS